MDMIRTFLDENHYVHRVEGLVILAIVLFLLYVAVNLNLFKKTG